MSAGGAAAQMYPPPIGLHALLTTRAVGRRLVNFIEMLADFFQNILLGLG
jgi:hypothetical protein